MTTSAYWLPVDAGAVPGNGFDPDSAARERQHREFVVDDEPGGIVQGEERDPAHVRTWGR